MFTEVHDFRKTFKIYTKNLNYMILYDKNMSFKSENIKKC